PAGQDGSAGLGRTSPQEIAVGRVRTDASYGASAPAHRSGSVRDLFLFLLPVSARAVRWETMKKHFEDAIQERPLLGDGAMGTQLMLAGLEQGNCGEEWNLTHPERVLAIQRRYAEAGSDCILTNTFGGSRIMLNRHSNGGRAVEINRAAVGIARAAFGGR